MRCAEYHLSVNMGWDDAKFRWQRYQAALQQAKAADSRDVAPKSARRSAYDRIYYGTSGSDVG